MRLTLTQLKHLSVETVSGVKLGRVHDVVFEIDGQLVAQYLVRRPLLGGALYRISRDQVVRFEEHRLIVDDGVVKESVQEEVFGKKQVRVEPVLTREE
ncbi:MAG: PRC-barrel domain-containing protein [Patescibacteria group bacterium]